MGTRDLQLLYKCTLLAAERGEKTKFSDGLVTGVRVALGVSQADYHPPCTLSFNAWDEFELGACHDGWAFCFVLFSSWHSRRRTYQVYRKGVHE